MKKIHHIGIVSDNLDFVYIDANHDYKFITEDMRNFWKKVRIGGIMGGHDYYNGYQRMCDDVIRAVGEFAYENKLQLRVETYPFKSLDLLAKIGRFLYLFLPYTNVLCSCVVKDPPECSNIT